MATKRIRAFIFAATLLVTWYATANALGNSNDPDYQFDVMLTFPDLAYSEVGQTDTNIYFSIRERTETADYVIKPRIKITLRGICTKTLDHPLPGGDKGTWSFSHLISCDHGPNLDPDSSHGWRLILVDENGKRVHNPGVNIDFVGVNSSRETTSEDGQMQYRERLNGNFHASKFRIDVPGYEVLGTKWEREKPGNIASHRLVSKVKSRQHQTTREPSTEKETADPPQPARITRSIALRLADLETKRRTGYWPQTSLLIRGKNHDSWDQVDLTRGKTPSADLQIRWPIPEDFTEKSFELYIVVEAAGDFVLVPFSRDQDRKLLHRTEISKKVDTSILELHLPRIPRHRFTVKAIDSEGQPLPDVTVATRFTADSGSQEEIHRQTNRSGYATFQIYDHGPRQIKYGCFLTGYRFDYKQVLVDHRPIGELECRLRKLETAHKDTVEKDLPTLARFKVLGDRGARSELLNMATLTLENSRGKQITLYTDQKGLAMIPMAPDRPFRSIRINKECFHAHTEDISKHRFDRPKQFLLKRSCFELNLSLKFVDAKKKTNLARPAGSRAEVWQGGKKLTDHFQFDSAGYAIGSFPLERGKGDLEIRASVNGFESAMVMVPLAEINDLNHEVQLDFHRAGSGLLFLINTAQRWGGYVDARTSIVTAVNDLVNSKDHGFVHLGMGALSGEVHDHALETLHNNPAELRSTLQTFGGISAARGMFQPRDLLSLIEDYRAVFAEAGEWEVVLVVPHNDVFGSEEKIDSEPYQTFLSKLRAADIKLSIVEHGGKSEIYKDLCETSGGHYKSLDGVGVDEYKQAFEKVLQH